MDRAAPSTFAAVRAQVDRLAASTQFAGSDRLVAFLRFIVDETLEGRGASLKESVVGNTIYGREPTYDSRIDSTVRVEARRLRRKLRDYYAGEGRSDPVTITVPTGRYAAAFAVNGSETDIAVPVPCEGISDAIFQKGSGAHMAIMPFRALSGNPEDQSFADGLTDELMFVLARSPGIRTISRDTAFQFKNRAYSPASLAAELTVDCVLQGTVRREGALIRVTIDMSDPRGFTVWSDRFDAPNSDHLQLQERIAATILSRVRLDSSQMRAMQIRPGPAALDAHSTIVRGRQLLDLQTPVALYEALSVFTRVAGSASDYARGHSGIADCYCDLFRLGIIDHTTAASAAKLAVLRALEVDPASLEAHAAAATIAAWFEYDRTAAENAFEKALSLGENARAARIYGVFLTILERHEDAARLFREARRIEPFSTQQDIAESISLYQARRFREVIVTGTIRQGQRLAVEALVYAALAAVFTGEAKVARSLLIEIEDGAARHADFVFAQAEIKAWLGQPEDALRLTNISERRETCFAQATLAIALGDEVRSLKALEASIERRELSRVWMRTDRRFDRLRGSKQFTRLINELGVPAKISSPT